MKILYQGKTKDVYEIPDGRILLRFKDDVTGSAGKIDPGANEVLGQVAGKGTASLRLSAYFFARLAERGIPTHFISANLEDNTMIAKKGDPFGVGLEFICRLKAYGSFLRRYASSAKALQGLNYLVEITLKDDERGDPLLNDDTILTLGIMTPRELSTAKELTKRSTEVVAAELNKRALQLIDIKFEFARIQGEVVLVDEVSGDNMRVMNKEGKLLMQRELCKVMLG